MADRALFRANGDGTYDLTVGGRALDYDLRPDEFSDAIRRSRRQFEKVEIEDETGYRQPLR